MNEKKPKDFSRRNFIRNASIAAAGITIVPRHVLGKGYVAPSDKLNIGSIGAGGKGQSDIANFFKSGNANIVALCDVDDRASAKTRANFPKATYYKDFREMLDKEKKNIDAVSVSIPDHGTCSSGFNGHANGQACICSKANDTRYLRSQDINEAARKYKVVTQMGNQGSSGDGVRLMMDWYKAGLIGDAHTIRCWTNRPVWPQGTGYPTTKDAIPPELDWNLWLGPTAIS